MNEISSLIKIPTYEEALQKHETPLDAFISCWEPVNHKSDTKRFREDLAALIEFVAKQARREQIIKELGY